MINQATRLRTGNTPPTPGHRQDRYFFSNLLKDLEKENERLRKAVSDLTLEKLILREAASGNF